MKYKCDLYFLRRIGRIVRLKKRLMVSISNQKIGDFIWVKKESFLKDVWLVFVLRFCLRRIGWCLGFPCGVQRTTLREATSPWWQVKRAASTESLPRMAADVRRSAAFREPNEFQKNDDLHRKIKEISKNVLKRGGTGSVFGVFVVEMDKAQVNYI